MTTHPYTGSLPVLVDADVLDQARKDTLDLAGMLSSAGARTLAGQARRRSDALPTETASVADLLDAALGIVAHDSNLDAHAIDKLSRLRVLVDERLWFGRQEERRRNETNQVSL